MRQAASSNTAAGPRGTRFASGMITWGAQGCGLAPKRRWSWQRLPGRRARPILARGRHGYAKGCRAPGVVERQNARAKMPTDVVVATPNDLDGT